MPSSSVDDRPRDGTVELTETHGSWVFLTDDRVDKIKQPVVRPFLD